MNPGFSEFSYGFAVTEEIINWMGLRLRTAPEFLSLTEEGKKGKGYDVQLVQNGIPLFLQFKCADYIKYTWNSEEFKKGYFSTPFYRFDLRPTKYSSQHPSLLDLEAQGYEVYYVAPVFHEVGELNIAYYRNQVIDESIIIRPSTIGALPDDKTHCISYDVNRTAYLLSDPVSVKPLSGEQLARHLRVQVRERGGSALSENSLAHLADTLIEITNERRSEEYEDETTQLRQLPPLRQIGYLARTFLDCAFFIVSESETRN